MLSVVRASLMAFTLTNAIHKQQVLQSHLSKNLSATSILCCNITTPVDHFNATDSRTYQNRYWVNDAFYQTGGPVIFYDFGEGGVSDDSMALHLGKLENISTASVALAKRFHGLIIGWEHRFYGQSLPFPLNGATPDNAAEAYQFLTIEQALEDVVYFANHFTPPKYGRLISPKRTPWIWIGGSYPGTRGTFLRLRNPEVIYAVWASSASVEAREDLGIYYNPIYRSMPQNCSSDVHAVIRYVDGILSSSQHVTIANLKQRVYAAQANLILENENYNTTTGLGLNEFEIASFLSQPIVRDFQSLGPQRTTQRFCSWMQSYNPAFQPTYAVNLTDYMHAVFSNPGNNNHSDSGVVSRYGLNTGLNAYIYASRLVLRESLLRAANQSISLADVSSWQWQSLTEMGNIQGSQAGMSRNLLSKYVNISALRSHQMRTWFGALEPGVLPTTANVDTVNRYGGWGMQPSNVMFTNGEFDPWRSSSVASEEEGAPTRRIVQTIPRCGETASGTDVFGLVYPGAAHVWDLWKTPDDELRHDTPHDTGLELFSRALEQWLPCFRAEEAVF